MLKLLYKFNNIANHSFEITLSLMPLQVHVGDAAGVDRRAQTVSMFG